MNVAPLPKNAIVSASDYNDTKNDKRTNRAPEIENSHCDLSRVVNDHHLLIFRKLNRTGSVTERRTHRKWRRSTKFQADNDSRIPPSWLLKQHRSVFLSGSTASVKICLITIFDIKNESGDLFFKKVYC